MWGAATENWIEDKKLVDGRCALLTTTHAWCLGCFINYKAPSHSPALAVEDGTCLLVSLLLLLLLFHQDDQSTSIPLMTNYYNKNRYNKDTILLLHNPRKYPPSSRRILFAKKLPSFL
jgi:hypothetical protein